jgi:hypothetical protein
MSKATAAVTRCRILKRVPSLLTTTNRSWNVRIANILFFYGWHTRFTTHFRKWGVRIRVQYTAKGRLKWLSSRLLQ